MTAETHSKPLLAPPDKVGPYRIEGRLGSGGMGAVYRAWDDRLERPLAIKQILADKAEDAVARERFRREAKAAAGLNHPAIVQIHDIVETEDGDWIVMELIEGQSLWAILQAGPLEPIRALRVSRQVASGLAEAHTRGIIHRDLKAENVMVTAQGHVKILDFGLSKRVRSDPQDPSLSAHGVVLGTLRTMSPEQAMGLPVDPRSDLFSLGVLIYEAVTGESPFLTENAATTLTRVCNYRQPLASQLRPEVPAALADLIDQLLEKEPEARPQTAQDVIAALDQIAATFGSLADGDETTWVLPGAPYANAPATATLRGFEGSQADSGTVVKTLLLSDLVGSTELVDRLGDEGAANLFHRHDRLARDLLAEYGGLEIDKSDGFLMLFERPLAAVLYALAYHQGLATMSEEEGVELQSRVGIHVGEVILHRNPRRDVARGAKPLEVEGLAKPMAARLMTLARGGQTLISRGVYDMARRAAVGSEADTEDLSWQRHGRYDIKGVEEPAEVFEVGHQGVAPFTPPDDSNKARRMGEGSATEAGRRLTRRWLVVAPLLALAAFAVGFGLQPWKQADSAALKGRPSVSVLGFKNSSGQQQLGWMSTAFSEMLRTELAAGSKLRIISGESVARMKIELALPETDTLALDTLKKIRRNLDTDYVVLGSYLAIGEGQDRSIRFDFWLQDTTTGDSLAVASKRGTERDLFSIVSQAGAHLRAELGIEAPTVEEAGAVRASVSSNPEATRLYAEGLAKLRSYEALAARDLLEQAVIADPTYALAHAALSEAWTALGYDSKAEATARQAFELSKGLPREETLAIQGRYYGASSNWDEAVEAYRILWGFFEDNVEYGLKLAGAQIQAARPSDARATVTKLRTLPPPASDDPRIDLTEAAVENSISNYRGAVAIAERATQKGKERGAWILVAESLLMAGIDLHLLGEYERAETTLEEARRLFTEAGIGEKIAEALSPLASQRDYQGDTIGAERLYRESLEIHRRTGNRKETALLLNNLADLLRVYGQLSAATQMFEESLQLAREVSDRRGEAIALNNLAQTVLEQGDLARSKQIVLESQAINGEIGRRTGVGWNQRTLGQIALLSGQLASAVQTFEKGLEIAEGIDNRHLQGILLRGMAQVHLARGDLEAAKEAIASSLETHGEIGEVRLTAQTNLTQARIALAENRFAEAARRARDLAGQFDRQRQLDLSVAATTVLAEALDGEAKTGEAREVLARAMAIASASENPTLRLSVAVADARFRAADGQAEQALATLASVISESEVLGLTGTTLAARLAVGEIEAASGGSSERLQKLAEEADTRGYGLVARRARIAAGTEPG